MNQYLTIDVGGTAIKYAIMDEEANVINKDDIPTPTKSMDDFLEALDSIVLPVKGTIKGIAISLPGKIDNVRGFAYTGGALSAFIMNTPLRTILEDRYELPVAIENDGKCAALAEAWQGNLSDVSSGVVIILGTGIGGGIVLNKSVWRGFKGSAGELSAMPTNIDNGIDMKSCWAYINGYGGLTVPYATIKGIDPNEMNGKIFFQDLHNGDEVAKKIFDQFVKTLAAGIISIQSVLDVERYCIGGGISAQDILIDATRAEVDSYFDSYGNFTPLNRPEVDRCEFRADANLIGALKNFFNVHQN